MADPIIEKVAPVKLVSTAVTGGVVKRHPVDLTGNHVKAWGRVESTVGGKVVIQAKLPDGTVHDLVTVAADVPAGHKLMLATRVLVNVVEVQEGGD